MRDGQSMRLVRTGGYEPLLALPVWLGWLTMLLPASGARDVVLRHWRAATACTTATMLSGHPIRLRNSGRTVAAGAVVVIGSRCHRMFEFPILQRVFQGVRHRFKHTMIAPWLSPCPVPGGY